jgi:F-type H+-transporting ATPase subunit b
MEIINTLGIDVTLLLAQMLNFGILVAVLAFLVYKPLLKLIDDRRESIRKSMEDADKISRQREEMDQARRAELQKIEKEATKLLDQAKADVF